MNAGKEEVKRRAGSVKRRQRNRTHGGYGFITHRSQKGHEHTGTLRPNRTCQVDKTVTFGAGSASRACCARAKEPVGMMRGVGPPESFSGHGPWPHANVLPVSSNREAGGGRQAGKAEAHALGRADPLIRGHVTGVTSRARPAHRQHVAPYIGAASQVPSAEGWRIEMVPFRVGHGPRPHNSTEIAYRHSA